jgi:sugar phosphate isomerase/epimerase
VRDLSRGGLEHLSLNWATVREKWDLGQTIDGCARQGLRGIAPWREPVQALGVEEAGRRIRDAGLRVSGYCRAGLFPAADAAGLRAAIDETRRAVDEAAALGAECLVILGGGMPPGSKDLALARRSGPRRHRRGAASCPRRRGAARDRAPASDVCRRSLLRHHAQASQ